ncbi:methylmalonyl Co-A mutase-associated GTPase MeaB [Zavarzinia sp. CC-PAN008]|uniref:methylmalonyl Co-A mutase-associated GTPase MeaB n=1 Tax=Zavarzinia sp. CC-PAN008 TaxID=3243332 RepID=UPI003F748DA0
MSGSAHPLAPGLVAGDRRALARAITLVESTRADHRLQAEALLAEVMPKAGGAIRIGLSGPPGVGKSTFIEAFGMFLTGQGLKVAVLAVDPSSSRSGGSILGDKTRMERLSREANAFIRPSPSGGTLGGVARRTREAMVLCEAAGFDVVLVETVGVGQSEIAVAGMVDLFTVLLSPAGGDDLQGIKRGIMELADLVVVNKADGAMETPARHAAADVTTALHLMRPKYTAWGARVLLTSARTGKGIAEVWETAQAFRTALGPEGLAGLRAEQARGWLWREVEDAVRHRLADDPVVGALSARLEAEVAAGRLAPGAAARQVLEALFPTSPAIRRAG